MKIVIKRLLSTISPEFTTKLMFYHNFGKKLDLKNPVDFNEKLQYLKLRTYYNNSVITRCADKYAVRGYMEDRGYAELLPSLLGGPYERAKDLREEWDKFPKRFVIKCNHGCGYNILISDKSKVNLDEVVSQLDKWMREDFWKNYCETQYRFIQKRIIVEEHLGENIQTYKFYCVNQNPEMLYVSSNGENGEKDLYLDYFNMEWEWLPITLAPHLHAKKPIPKPKSFDKMVEIAKELSKDFPFVRIDLYDVEGKVFLSEFTFIPTGGNMKLDPPEVLEEWGSMLRV